MCGAYKRPDEAPCGCIECKDFHISLSNKANELADEACVGTEAQFNKCTNGMSKDDQNRWSRICHDVSGSAFSWVKREPDISTYQTFYVTLSCTGTPPTNALAKSKQYKDGMYRLLTLEIESPQGLSAGLGNVSTAGENFMPFVIEVNSSEIHIGGLKQANLHLNVNQIVAADEKGASLERRAITRRCELGGGDQPLGPAISLGNANGTQKTPCLYALDSQVSSADTLKMTGYTPKTRLKDLEALFNLKERLTKKLGKDNASLFEGPRMPHMVATYRKEFWIPVDRDAMAKVLDTDEDPYDIRDNQTAFLLLRHLVPVIAECPASFQEHDADPLSLGNYIVHHTFQGQENHTVTFVRFTYPQIMSFTNGYLANHSRSTIDLSTLSVDVGLSKGGYEFWQRMLDAHPEYKNESTHACMRLMVRGTVVED